MAETDLGMGGGSIYSYSLAGGYAPNSNVTGFTDSVMGTWGYGYGHRIRADDGVASAGTYLGLNLSWTLIPLGTGKRKESRETRMRRCRVRRL